MSDTKKRMKRLKVAGQGPRVRLNLDGRDFKFRASVPLSKAAQIITYVASLR